MVEKYLFFNSTFDDRRRYGALDMAEYWRSFLSTGLIHADGKPSLRVIANGEDMTIRFDDGRALIFGHLYLKEGDLPFTLSPSSATEDRFDRIILRYDNIRGKDDSRYIRAFLVEGTAEGPPELMRTFVEDEPIVYELSLAQIHVKAGKSYIEQSDIIDERLDEELCGLASSLVTVPTDILTEEWREFVAEYNKWFANLQGSAFATVDDVRESENNMKREIANLNLQLEANKRIKNGVTFGTNFADSFGMEIDMARTSSDEALEVGQTVINVRDASDFRAGTEVTIFDNVNLERVNIASISGDEITLERALAKDYKEGVNIARSMLLINKFGRYAEFGAWGSYEKRVYDGVSIDKSVTTYNPTSTTNATRAGDSWYILLQGSSSRHSLFRAPDSTMKWEPTDLTDVIMGAGGNLSSDNKFVFCVHAPSLSEIVVSSYLEGVLVDTKTLSYVAIGTPNRQLTTQFNEKTRELYIIYTKSVGNNNKLGFFSLPISTTGFIGVPVADLELSSPESAGSIYVDPKKNAEVVVEDDGIYVFVRYVENTNFIYPIVFKIENSYDSSIIAFDGRQANIFVISGTRNAFFKYGGFYYIAMICSDTTSRTSIIGKSLDMISWEWFEITGITRTNFVVYNGKGSIFVHNYGGSGVVTEIELDNIPSAAPTTGYNTDNNATPFTPFQQESEKPFIFYGNGTFIDGDGVIGYGSEITTNDIRFKIKPSKELVTWLQHDKGLTVTEATFGNINLDLSTLDDETQAVGYTTKEQDEVRLTIERDSIDDDVKAYRILGGTS